MCKTLQFLEDFCLLTNYMYMKIKTFLLLIYNLAHHAKFQYDIAGFCSLM